MAGVLYTVATPIGNLEDITSRAIKTLSAVDYILCEDTRVSAKLMAHFGIKAKLITYHKFNEKEQLERIVNDLKSDMNIALISDAGTPCISDPGRILVNELFKIGIKIVPISGACAVSTLLSAAPKTSEEYTFTGFIPRNLNEQEKFLQKYSTTDVIFYESPNRLLKTLENIKKILGNDVKITVGRELTKVYEEIKYGSISEITDYYSAHPPKGEIAVLLYKKETSTQDKTEFDERIKILTDKGFSAKDISIILSSLFDVNKNTIYKKINENNH